MCVSENFVDVITKCVCVCVCVYTCEFIVKNIHNISGIKDLESLWDGGGGWCAAAE